METMQRTAWLYTKDQESVRLGLARTSAGVQLTIEGPGEATSKHEFPPGTSVDGFRQEYEQKLIAGGFKLQAVTERRSEGPRRAGGDRRRRE